MDLIWTYSSKLKRSSVKYSITKDCRLRLYKDSIKKASRFYTTYLYTDKEGAAELKGLADTTIILPEKFDYYFLDDIKFYVIQVHSRPFTLIDGDLLLDSKLQFEVEKVGIEKFLPLTGSYYEKYNRVLEKEGVVNVIPFWESYQDSFNIGLIYIPNDFPKQEFIYWYNKMKSFYKEKIEPKYKFLSNSICIEMSTCTYLLSLFVKYKNISYFYFNERSKFTHYSGTRLKFEYCNAFTPKSII